MSDYNFEERISYKTLIILQLIIIITAILGLGLVKYVDAVYIDNSIIQSIFKVITYLGDTLVFIVIIAIIYIVYDKKYAKNLTFALLTTVYINSFLKDVFMDPRPAENSIPGGYQETSYGFPSGHSQGSSTFWGYVGYEFNDKPKPKLIPVIFSGLIFLVVLSRLILGVHDVQDVTGGLILGIGVLLAFIYLEPIVSKRINSLEMLQKILIGVVASLVLFIFGTLLFPTSGEQLLASPTPFADTGAYAQVGGVILGISVGYVLENEYVDYQPSRLEMKWKIINLIIGLIVVFVIYFGLEFLKDIFNSVIFRYFRYAIIAFILVLVVPWIFTKINPTQ
ncbi:MAG: PAP2 superfamily protein [Promethearchaeota archaeon]|jgi:membrane-associated phospholipid phosphatase|nr:MAG: PAP2 superfamily protein [Candidatus Lokiarchaeota archaeon]